MEILGKKINLRYILWYYCFNGLIIIDMFLITIALIFEMPDAVIMDIQYFDLFVCIVLLAEYTLNLYLSSPKKKFLLDPLNILGFIASIPFDFILATVTPESILLRYLRLLKISRILLLSSRLKFLKEMFQKTGLHKILGVIFATIILFTALLYYFGPSYGAFDDFYFVVVTLTTVGYGDITPQTYNEKVLSLILILIGIFVFSAVTAAMSSFLTDRILDKNETDIKEMEKSVLAKSEEMMNEVKLVRKENKQLKEEISELKELIKNK